MRNFGYLQKRSEYNIILNYINNPVSSIEYDSRKCKEDSLFVAIRGESFDGHDYIDQAISNGAKFIVCEVLPKEILPNISYMTVNNSRKSLAELSHAWYDYPSKKMKMIGITGTNGKTTITFLLKDILEKAGLKTAIIGTTGIFFGNEKIPATHTTPESLELSGILNTLVEKGVEYTIMEVSSHALMQYRVFGIDFLFAGFTNLTHDHLDYHKNMGHYASAKKILFDSMRPEGYAVFNADDPYSKFILSTCRAEKIEGISRNDSDWIIKDEILDLDSNKFCLIKKNKFEISIKTPLIGRFNNDNLTVAIAIANALGIDVNTINEAVSSAIGAPGRMQRILLSNGAVGIVDYAHTPDALQKAILSCKDVIESAEADGAKLICVFGCGGNRDTAKRPEMGKIAGEFADFTIITDDNPRMENSSDILAMIESGIDHEFAHKYQIIADRAKAIEKAFEMSNKNDIILVAGKGHENYQIIGKDKIHFDDAEELFKYR